MRNRNNPTHRGRARGEQSGRRQGRQELANRHRLNGETSPGVIRRVFGTGRAHRLPRP